MKRCVWLAIGWAACVVAPPSQGEAVFLASDDDFANFRQWEAFPVPETSDGGDIHSLGPRIEYLRQRPDAGSAAFPIGTIIVKAMMSDPPRNFAMAKRGGDFNDAGCVDWEFFEIVEDGGAHILWRGEGAPFGSQYPGDPMNVCNGCHVAGVANDYVLSQKLQLQNL